MRDEAPLWYNEKYDFFALSRWDDVEAGLKDWETFRSGKGSTLEIIKADIAKLQELERQLQSAT